MSLILGLPAGSCWRMDNRALVLYMCHRERQGQPALTSFEKVRARNNPTSSMGASSCAIAIGRLPIPWPFWPTCPSLFHPRSRSTQQLAKPPRTDSDGAPIPNTNPGPDCYPPSPLPPPTEHENQNRGAMHHRKAHPNVVHLVDAAWHRTSTGTYEVFILMEYCPGSFHGIV